MTNPPLPPEIQKHSLTHGVRYELPRRPLGKWRYLALVPLAIVVLFLVPFLHWIASFASEFLDGFGAAPVVITTVFLGFFLVPFVTASGALLGFGCFMLAGHSEIALVGGRLIATERAGWLWWRRKHSLQELVGFEVGGAQPRDGQRAISGPLTDLRGLAAEFRQGKPMVLALGYPRHWLVALAQELSNQVPQVSLGTEARRGPPPVELIEPRAVGLQVEDYPEQPAGSAIRLQPQGTSVLVTVPPAGVRRGSKGLFFAAVFWCVLTGGFTGVLVFASGKGAVPMFVYSILALLWGVGIAMLAGAVNMGRRRAVIVADAQGLRLAQESLFGKKKWDWRRDQVKTVCVGPSGMAVNNVPVLELRIVPTGAAEAGFFAGRDEEELLWLATVLRRQLGIR